MTTYIQALLDVARPMLQAGTTGDHSAIEVANGDQATMQQCVHAATCVMEHLSDVDPFTPEYGVAMIRMLAACGVGEILATVPDIGGHCIARTTRLLRYVYDRIIDHSDTRRLRCAKDMALLLRNAAPGESPLGSRSPWCDPRLQDAWCVFHTKTMRFYVDTIDCAIRSGAPMRALTYADKLHCLLQQIKLYPIDIETPWVSSMQEFCAWTVTVPETPHRHIMTALGFATDAAMQCVNAPFDMRGSSTLFHWHQLEQALEANVDALWVRLEQLEEARVRTLAFMRFAMRKQEERADESGSVRDLDPDTLAMIGRLSLGHHGKPIIHQVHCTPLSASPPPFPANHSPL